MSSNELRALRSPTAILLTIGVIVLAVSTIGYAQSVDQGAKHIGAVVLGSGGATLVGGLSTLFALLVARRRWAEQETKRLEDAAVRLSRPNLEYELRHAPQSLDALLEGAVVDTARELGVDPQRLSGYLLLMDKENAFVWPDAAPGQDSEAIAAAGRRAVEKNAAMAVRASSSAKEAVPHWFISVPIPTSQGQPAFGAIVLSGTNESASKPLTREDLEPVVSLLLGWARLAALKVGAPSSMD